MSDQRNLTREVIEAAQAGSSSSQAIVLNRMEPFVVSIAGRVADSSQSIWPDLLQEGRIAVLEVLKDFNFDGPARFESAAYRPIRGAIIATLQDAGQVSIPSTQLSRYWAAMRVADSPQEAREIVEDMDAATFDAIHAWKTNTVPFTEEPGEDEDMAPTVPSTGEGDLATSVETKLLAELVLETAKTPRDRLVLEMAYGFVSGEPMSDREIAESIDVSRQYVQKVRTQAIAHIQKTMEVTP